jgi:NADH-quinone oxidoreductase subunit K
MELSFILIVFAILILLVKPNLLFVLFALEIILLSINLNFILASLMLDDFLGQYISLILFSIAALDTSVGLIIVLVTITCITFLGIQTPLKDNAL